MRTPPLRALLWNAIVAEVGEPATKSERGRINSAIKELCEAEPTATPEDVPKRAQRFREIYPGAMLTARALAANWGQLDPERRTAAERERDDLEADMSVYNRA